MNFSNLNQNNRNLKIAIASSRLAKTWKNQEINWLNFKEMVRKTKRTAESISEYKKMSKQKQDLLKDVGGFVGGTLKEGKRKNGHIIGRSLLTLDMDYAKPGICEIIELLCDWECCIYSTHKSTPESPRFRTCLHNFKYGFFERFFFEMRQKTQEYFRILSIFGKISEKNTQKYVFYKL
jgi:hypothetical protein